ncbi:MAG: LamG-like jellyroll fold domain-containing protein [Planctomycetota bacterium]
MPVAYYTGKPIATAAAIASAGQTVYSPHGSDVMQAEAAIDVEYEYYAKWGAGSRDPNLPIMLNIEATMNEMNALYIRDCMIDYVLGRVVIRTSPETCPYYDLDRDFDKLGPMRTEWRNNHSDSTHDLAALVYNGGGGMAWVGVVCNRNYAFSINGDSGDGTFHHVWRHEAGHNWACADYHKGCPEGRTILCGNSMSVSRFSVEEVKTILRHRDSRSCLINIGPYPSPIPPYAALDTATVHLGDSPIAITVLANDHDANGDALAIDSFEQTSSLGGTIELRPPARGAPPALIYTPPPGNYGNDTFTYTIADGTGNYATGNVHVEVRNNGLTGYWNLDETSGAAANDSSGGGNHGILTNMDDADWVNGQYGNALEFDDINDYLYMEDFSMTRDSFTTALWFKPAENMDSSDSRADLFYWHRGSHPHLTFNRSSGGRIGLYVDVNDVEYNDCLTTTDSWSALQWYHIAFTFDGADFNVYVNGTLENTVNHPGIHTANEGLSVGSDEGRRGPGCTIDDIRFYNYALSPSAVQALVAGALAENPIPQHRIANVRPHTALQWTPGLAAVSHDVYLGTEPDAVAGATTAYCEYKARLAEPQYFGPALIPETEYFWRIDEVLQDDTVIPGQLWSFTTGLLASYDSIYEAEQALLSGPEIEDSQSGYTGSGYIDYINTSGDYAEYTVLAHYSGPHELAFRYALTSGNRPLEIRLDGDLIEPSLDFPSTGSWANWDYTEAVPVTLPAGPHNIRATIADYKGANIDHLKIIESSPPGLPGDITGNGQIDIEDFAEFAAQWGQTDCTDNPPCAGADLDGNRNVNSCDLAVLGELWLEGK